jgi:Ca-activated chloride channel family protein
VDGPAEVEAGSEITVSWTGPNAQDDFITIVKAGTEAWTNEPYFYTRFGNEGSLVAPLEAGEYELWYVAAADNSTQARSPITVTGFTGSLAAPGDVEAGTEFEVDWTGPNGPGDFVTIVAAGTERWTDESYFYTASGSPGTLVAPTSPGAYEVWYVTGVADTPSARRPITVTAATVTLEAPATVEAGEAFEVRWTGPNGPSDYITIVPVGSAEGTYGDYAYTSTGNPVRLTAPGMPGNYEIWYASDRVEGTFGRRSIIVE